MKVYILSQDGFPKGMAATNRIMNYARGVVASGVDCEVVVSRRTESASSPQNREACGVAEGVAFRYISPSTCRFSSKFMRRWHVRLEGWRNLCWIKKNIKEGDVVLYFNRDINQLGAIARACHKKGAKIVRELCELPYSTRSDAPRYIRRRKRYERKAMPLFDGFIAISQSLEEYAAKHARHDAAIVKVPILIDADQYESVEAYSHPRPYIFHAGTMYERKDAIVSTMKAFAKASKEIDGEVDFLLAGPASPHKAELDAIIEEGGLGERVRFIGKLSHDEVLRYQKGAWLSILNKHDNAQNRNGFSTKLGDVLLAGTPVITTTVGEANNYLKDGVSALITEPHKVDAIAEQIVRAYRSPELMAKISMECERVARENFDYRIQGVRMKEYFENLSK